MPRRADGLFDSIASFRAVRPAAWPASRSQRVNRGGSRNKNPRNLRSANRNRNTTDNRNNNVVFGVASTPQAGAAHFKECAGARKRVQGRPSSAALQDVAGVSPWEGMAGVLA